MTLKKINGKWMIYREWYLDPLDENPMVCLRSFQTKQRFQMVKNITAYDLLVMPINMLGQLGGLATIIVTIVNTQITRGKVEIIQILLLRSLGIRKPEGYP